MRYLVITLLLLTSCASKKSFKSVDVLKRDSIVVKIEQVKSPLLQDIMIVPEICKDSVATEFKKIYIRDTDTIIVEVKNNELVLDVRQKERVISELRERIHKKDMIISEKEKQIKEKIAWKPILILSGIIVLFLAFPTIPSIIKKIF